MGIRYLGSKARVVGDLAQLLAPPTSTRTQFVDAFAGTGSVASIAADLGWRVHVNDHLRCARVMSTARLLSRADAEFAAFGGYRNAISRLNGAAPLEGFMWREYSPASRGHAPRPRLYFTEANAAHLDGMRLQIAKWRTDGSISENEETLLIADLLEAASSVANTAGTFGCFLASWSVTALRSVQVEARVLRVKRVKFSASEEDVFSLKASPGDTVYLDPPYTKRQYAAYYHVLETLAYGDEPVVSGVTGLRPWHSKNSPFCHKQRALPAMLRLVESLDASRVLISYSAEGHIDLEALAGELQELGTVRVHTLGEIARYQPNRTGSTTVGEFVLELTKVGG